MKPITIFISYNPRNATEQTLAVRLHTIGAVNGFNMLLPDRFNSFKIVDETTKQRIRESNYFILFSSGRLSPLVTTEIAFAYSHFKDKSKILVLHDANTAKLGTSIGANEQFTIILFNPRTETLDQIIQDKIIPTIRHKERFVLNSQSVNKGENALLTLLGVGLGLYILSKVSSE